MLDKQERRRDMEYKRITKVSPELRNKAVAFIQKNFPELEADIETFASKHNLEKGDAAAATIIDIIIPELEALGAKK